MHWYHLSDDIGFRTSSRTSGFTRKDAAQYSGDCNQRTARNKHDYRFEEKAKQLITISADDLYNETVLVFLHLRSPMNDACQQKEAITSEELSKLPGSQRRKASMILGPLWALTPRLSQELGSCRSYSDVVTYCMGHPGSQEFMGNNVTAATMRLR